MNSLDSDQFDPVTAPGKHKAKPSSKSTDTRDSSPDQSYPSTNQVGPKLDKQTPSNIAITSRSETNPITSSDPAPQPTYVTTVQYPGAHPAQTVIIQNPVIQYQPRQPQPPTSSSSSSSPSTSSSSTSSSPSTYHFLFGGIMRWPHITSRLFFDLFFDVFFCVLSVGFNFANFVNFKGQSNPYTQDYRLNFCVAGSANAFFALTVIVAFMGLYLANGTLLLIYIIRCVFVTVFQISVKTWIIILWTNYPFYFDDQYSGRNWAIFFSVEDLVFSLIFLYFAWDAYRCRIYYKSLKKK